MLPLSREEFLDFFFEDLELPDLVKTELDRDSASHERIRAGYRTDGTPSNLTIVRTLRESLARRIAFQGPHAVRLRELEAELEALGRDEADRDDPRVVKLAGGARRPCAARSRRSRSSTRSICASATASPSRSRSRRR